MKRFLLMSLALLACSSLTLSAQEQKHWTMGLSALHGSLADDEHAQSIGQGVTFAPSIRYYFRPSWSVGVSALLPAAKSGDPQALYYTTAGELSLRKDFELLPKFKLSLSAVGMCGLIGPYKHTKNMVEYAQPAGSAAVHGNLKLEHQNYRYLFGLRPSISYQFTPNWELELGYGFLGYRSNADIDDTVYIKGERLKGAAWGFDNTLGWGNALRIGLLYSF